MPSDLYSLFTSKNYHQIKEIVAANPQIANEGVSLDDNITFKKGHPLHRLCDAVFVNKITDEEAVEVAKILLAAGANIEGFAPAGDNNSPLLAAASLHAEKLGIYYIEQGADVSFSSRNDGATAIHWASFTGRDKLVQKLIEAGANINLRDTNYNSPPIGWAIETLRTEPVSNHYHQLNCIKLLLAAGADTNLHIDSVTFLKNEADKDPELKKYI